MRPLGSGSWRMASYQFMCLRPAGHTSIDEQSVCQTICDWNTSCAAYEWGAGCYLSSEWGFEAINMRFTEGGRAGGDVLVRYPLAPSLLELCLCSLLMFRPDGTPPAARPIRPNHECTLEFLCHADVPHRSKSYLLPQKHTARYGLKELRRVADPRQLRRRRQTVCIAGYSSRKEDSYDRRPVDVAR